eukprot:gnl/TRDRNA2_/TRDRNA2_184814_c0_seq1.p1 gnl/TRDRNA2_/TRDRNA2_184814_c0~~gnl/TRDRNA2_/TRDRNA2_184814_c0_seq1.p1  ORF type:complete len:237 (+),score=42.67 gnl/TRDRNA2_/TRDRNA2_184814_c0_seq1:83-712(+)
MWAPAWEEGYGYEEYDDGYCGDGSEAIEEEAYDGWEEVSAPPCANGSRCQFLQWGICRFHHTEEEWNEVSEGMMKAAQSSKPRSPGRPWNVLVLKKDDKEKSASVPKNGAASTSPSKGVSPSVVTAVSEKNQDAAVATKSSIITPSKLIQSIPTPCKAPARALDFGSAPATDRRERSRSPRRTSEIGVVPRRPASWSDEGPPGDWASHQ